MKILVKHTDNLKSSWNPEKESVPEYLVYLMTDDNIPDSCDVIYGEKEKDFQISMLQLNYQFTMAREMGLSVGDPMPIEFTLPIEEVSYKEFRNNNSVRFF